MPSSPTPSSLPPSDDPQPPQRNGRAGSAWRDRLRRGAIGAGVVLLLAVACTTGGVYYFTRPAAVRDQAARTLEALTGATVEIESAAFHFNAPIELRGVTLRVPGMAVGDQIFTAQRVLIDHDPAALWTGSISPTRVQLLGATVYATEIPSTRRFNFQLLQSYRAKRPDAPDARRPRSLPEILLPDAQVIFGQVRDGEYQQTEQIEVTGELLLAAEGGQTYEFMLMPTDAARHPWLTGRVDLAAGASSASLHNITLDSPLMNILPATLREWWLDHKPTGTLSPIRFLYDPTDGARVVIEVDGTEMTPPYCDPELRMRVRRGRFTFHNERIEPDLTGQIAGYDFEIRGVVADVFSKNPAVDLSLQMRGRLEPDPDFLNSLDPLLRDPIAEQLNKYSPRGPFEAAVRLERKPGDDTLHYDATVDLLGIDATYDEFRYPGRNVRGRVRVQPGLVEIGPITAVGLSGADIRIEGEVRNPGPQAESDVRIETAALPLDEHLFAALDEPARNSIRMFLSRPHHEALLERGLIRTEAAVNDVQKKVRDLRLKRSEIVRSAPSDSRDAAVESVDHLLAALELHLEQLQQAPAFELGGPARVHVIVDRRPDRERTWSTTVNINLSDQGMVFGEWPYPMRTRGGSVTVKDGVIQVNDVEVRGLSGAIGKLSGDLAPDPQRAGKLRANLTLAATDVPLDEYLLFTLPDSDAAWLRQLKLDAAGDATGRIFTDDQGRNRFHIQGALADASALPNAHAGGAYELSDVAADFTVEPDKLTLQRITASHGESRFTMSGLSRIEGDGRRLTLEVHGQHLRFDEPVIDLIPPQTEVLERLRPLFAQYQPRGVYDANLSFDSDGPYTLAVAPQSLSLVVAEHRLSLENVQGRLTVTPGQVRITDGRARFAEGSAAVSGTVTTDANPSYDLLIEAQSRSICPDTRSVLPRAVRSVIDQLQIAGPYHLTDAHLVVAPDDAENPGLNFTGRLAFDGASATVGVPITDLRGAMQLNVRTHPAQPWPWIDLNLQADELRAQNRRISPMRVRLNSDQREPFRLAITDGRGSVYGGSVTLNGGIELGSERTDYRTYIALQEVGLLPFIHPDREAQWRRSRPTNPADPDDGESPDGGTSSADGESHTSQHIAETQPSSATQQVDANTDADAVADTQSPHSASADAQQPAPDADNPDQQQPASAPADQTPAPTGVLSVSLSLEGVVGRVESQRGAGIVRIRDAHLYEFPIGLKMLELLNLAWPKATAFDRAAARYVVQGDDVLIEDVRIESPTIEMFGSGNLRWSTQAIDMRLQSRYPGGVPMGPFSRLWDQIKAELITIQITGTTDDPKVRTESFSGAMRAWRQFIGEPLDQP